MKWFYLFVALWIGAMTLLCWCTGTSFREWATIILIFIAIFAMAWFAGFIRQRFQANPKSRLWRTLATILCHIANERVPK